MIIGISGKSLSGKDTVGEIFQYLTSKKDAGYTHPHTEKDLNSYLTNNHDRFSKWYIKKFAYKVKVITSLLTGIPIEDLEKEEVKSSNLPECWNRLNGDFHRSDDIGYIITNPFYDVSIDPFYKKTTVREFMYILATDAIRCRLNMDTWVNALFVDYKP